MSAPASSLTGLSIDRLTLIRGGRLILKDVNLSVALGDCVLITGPNGVGKSTLLRAIAGFLPIRDGTIQPLGLADADDFPLSLHYQGHRDPIKPALTVAEHLRFWQRILGGPSPSQSDDLLTSALAEDGIAHLADVPGGYLSQGQRRRVSLTRFRLVPRPLWLLDEPTAGLDQQASTRFVNRVAQHCASGGMVICSTHEALDIPTARHLALSSPSHQGPAA